MATLVVDFGNTYVKADVYEKEDFLPATKDDSQKCIRSQLWFAENGSHFIGEYDKKKEGYYNGIHCSLNVLVKAVLHSEDAKLQIRNQAVGRKNCNTNVVIPLSSRVYVDMIEIFLDELYHTLTTAQTEGIKKVIFVIPKALSSARDSTFDNYLHRNLPVTFLLDSIAAAYGYGANNFIDGESFIVIDLGGSHSNFAIVKKINDSFVEHTSTHCNVGSKSIDILIYNWILSKLKNDKPRQNDNFRVEGIEHIELMKQCEDIKKKINISTAITHFEFEGTKERHMFKKEDFDVFVQPYVTSVISFVKKNARDVNLDDVTKVLLIGGSSKIKIIESELKQLFGQKLIVSNEPEFILVKGAGHFSAN